MVMNRRWPISLVHCLKVVQSLASSLSAWLLDPWWLWFLAVAFECQVDMQQGCSHVFSYISLKPGCAQWGENQLEMYSSRFVALPQTRVQGRVTIGIHGLLQAAMGLHLDLFLVLVTLHRRNRKTPIFTRRMTFKSS